jgi:isopentenyl phosphate kinase
MGGQPIGETETMNEYNAEYDDEAGMVDNNLETLKRAVEGLDELIQSGDNLPEWCQEKIAVAKSMLVSVWDYMYSEEASDEVDPEIDEMFEDGTISGGMLPKISSALDAAKSGVNTVHIIDGRIEHSLLLEVLTEQAFGTMIRSH